MKDYFYLKKGRQLLFALLVLLAGGASPAWADELTVANGTNTNDYIPIHGQNADYGLKEEYVIPATDLSSIDGMVITGMKLYAKTNNTSTKPNYGPFQIFMKEVESATPYKSSSASFLGTDDATTVYEGEVVISGGELSITFTTNYTYNGGNLLVGFYKDKGGNYLSNSFYGISQNGYTACNAYSSSGLSYISTGTGRMFIPKTTFTYENNTSGPALSVYDGATKIATDYSYSFGLATAGTEKAFTLKNPGTESITVAINGTNGYGVSPANATISAKGEQTLTVTMANASGDGSVTITPSESGVDAFTINVSGTIRDENKVYESDFSSLPADWATTGTWYYSAANGAYTTVWYLSSNARLITPKLTIAEGEKFFVEAKGYSTSNTSYQHLQMQYSADGSNWTNFDDEPSLDPSNWNTFEFTGCPVGSYYIAINASQADIRMFYGGQLPNEPKMVVTQPTSLDFGVITEATNKTFTIANTGKATLEGISVTSSNSSIFSITDAPTSLAAGESAEVTITMAATTTGALNSEITVSATGMEDVTFTVTGTVLPDDMSKEEFTDGLPTNWTNVSWTFANGEATGKSSSAYLTTPKLLFSAGELLVIKAKAADALGGDYITVQGSDDNGATFSAYTNKIDLPKDNSAWNTFVLSDIPTTVNKLRFLGYYVVVDEIWGLTYAPILSVTQGGNAVTTPANYDFGECADNASVTFNFANAGAGTITITGVSVTGDGVAAYNTNYSQETELPFDLTINRIYVAGREGAQDAVVTVTTTEGDFVINVTGSDKAANAPELAVTLGGKAVANGATADFGSKLQAAPIAKTYTITNSGTGTLTGTIATSDDTQFTVSKTEFSLGATESMTFDLALVYDANYGAKAATITIHPTNDGLEDIVINATASTLDPDAWIEDFDDATAFPLGWTGGTWTIGTYSNYGNTTKMALAPSSSTSGTMITPCLTAKKDDILSWDAYFKWADEALIVEYSTDDQNTWTEFCTIYGTESGEKGSGQVNYHKEMSFTAPADGDYYLRFTSTYQNGVDNFCGFKINLPDHVCAISGSNIPTSMSGSPTMKVGRSFEATVTVKENRGVAEALTAKVYMDNEVIGTATGNVAANGSETITITCTPTKSGYLATYIEVEYAGGTLTTTSTYRSVQDLTYLTLDENSSEAIVAGTYDNVTLKRTFIAGWNTVCLPFTISDVEEFFGTGAKAYEFSSFADGSTLTFEPITTLTASYPYIVYVPNAITEDFKLTDITIDSGDATAWFTRKDYNNNAVVAYFRGTYAPVAAGKWTKEAEDDIIYGVTTDAKIAKAGETASIDGFRAYFDLGAAASGARLAFTDDGGQTTYIDANRLNNVEDGKAYNLQGQRVENLKKGLYIINGKKKVVRK